MIFITKIKALHPITNELAEWMGDNIEAESELKAKDILNRTGRGYMKISGQLISEIPCFKGTLEADWSKRKDFD